MRDALESLLRQTVCALLVCCGVTLRPTHAGEEPVPSTVVVDQFQGVPVDMARGELRYTAPPDLRIPSRCGALDLTRNYESGRAEDGPFGYGWRWTHGDWMEFMGSCTIKVHTASATLTKDGTR